MGSGATGTTGTTYTLVGGRYVCETAQDATTTLELDEGHPLAQLEQATRSWRTWHDLATGRRVRAWRLEWR